MAEKRMFARKLIDSDAFLDMPLSAQALYFHLNMRADDDGFIDNPKRLSRYVGASDDDLKLLLVKRFVIGFESGVIVIKHWRMHNTIKPDRYHPTDYQEEFKRLGLREDKAYTEDPAKMTDGSNMDPTCLQNGSSGLGLDIGLGIGSDKSNNNHGKFVKPSLAEVADYIREKGYSWDAEAFYDHYESNGWKVGKNSMKDWKSACRNWERMRKDGTVQQGYRTGSRLSEDAIKEGAKQWEGKIHYD